MEAMKKLLFKIHFKLKICHIKSKQKDWRDASGKVILYRKIFYPKDQEEME